MSTADDEAVHTRAELIEACQQARREAVREIEKLIDRARYGRVDDMECLTFLEAAQLARRGAVRVVEELIERVQREIDGEEAC